MFPHEEFVLAPAVMEAELRNSENVVIVRIDVEVVCRTGEAWRLNQGADGSGIIALDVALEFRTEAFELIVVAGKFSAASTDIDGVAADEFFFAGIFEILPAITTPLTRTIFPSNECGLDKISQTVASVI